MEKREKKKDNNKLYSNAKHRSVIAMPRQRGTLSHMSTVDVIFNQISNHLTVDWTASDVGSECRRTTNARLCRVNLITLAHSFP